VSKQQRDLLYESLLAPNRPEMQEIHQRIGSGKWLSHDVASFGIRFQI
jgi:hypothetical protein